MTILRHHWRPATYRLRKYEAEFISGRQLFGPNTIRIRPGQSPSPETGHMSHDEALGLVSDGVFGTAGEAQGGSVLINEHAVNAFHDFCCDVWEAWDKFQARVQQVERTSKPGTTPDPRC